MQIQLQVRRFYCANGACPRVTFVERLPTVVAPSARRTVRLAQEQRAIGFAYTFLGIRIQCAQCHKHPFDQWSKSDFDAFKNFFARLNFNQYGSFGKEGQEAYDRMLSGKARFRVVLRTGN